MTQLNVHAAKTQLSWLLERVLHGEEIDPGRHRLGTIVKAATLHQVSVRTAGDGVETRLILDV